MATVKVPHNESLSCPEDAQRQRFDSTGKRRAQRRTDRDEGCTAFQAVERGLLGHSQFDTGAGESEEVWRDGFDGWWTTWSTNMNPLIEKMVSWFSHQSCCTLKSWHWLVWLKKKTVAKASNVNITDLFLAYAESTPKVFTVASTVNTHSFQLSALCVLK